MNLHEIFRRKLPFFTFGEHVTAAEEVYNGASWLGLHLPASDTPALIIAHVLNHRPLRSFPAHLNWFACSESSQAEIILRLRTTAGTVLHENRFLLDRPVWRIDLPWPPLTTDIPAANLEISCAGGTVFLGISRSLNRENLLPLCRGKGVEIGPGITPYILPGTQCDVLYAEEKSREDWLTTYAYKRDKYQVDTNTLPWERYRVADAFHLPADDASLDFIFASHVFEHLVNPLGHLEHWLAKLKPGGVIVGILPHCDFSGDYQMLPSMLPTIALEYQRKETRPSITHYRNRFGNQAEAMMREGRTLHVHFYNERNLQDFFSYAGGMLPLGAFRIQAESNYKEFFFTVTKR